jgi:hypothetical protein
MQKTGSLFSLQRERASLEIDETNPLSTASDYPKG